MALVLKESVKFYNYIFYDLADDRWDYLPLLKSPIPVTLIITVYLLFILKWGPRFMMDRKPFNLRNILIFYNAVQMVGCAIYTIYYTRLIPFNEWKCMPVDHPFTAKFNIILGGYIYFLTKILDLLDTVFFVLKKSYRQITFLHVFHHTTMILNIWLGLKYYPGGQSLYIPYINTIVHMVMYGYYLLTVYDDKYRKSIWWKKHITQLQLLQFGIVFILYTTPLIYDCGYPIEASVSILGFNGSMIALFSNFYYNTYIKKNK